MAYNTDDLYQEALIVIEKYKLFFLADVYAYLGIAASTFYDHFPEESKESKDIKDAIEKNKVQTKVSIRQKLHKSENTAGLLALYKLICTEDERKALAMEYRETKNENHHSVEIDNDSLREIIRDEW